MVCVELTNQLVRKQLFSHLDSRQKPSECSRKGRYIFVHVKYEAYLFLPVFLVAQGFLETLACLESLVHPAALEPLADLAHQEVLRWFVLRQTGLESGSELSYILPYDLSGKKKSPFSSCSGESGSAKFERGTGRSSRLWCVVLRKYEVVRLSVEKQWFREHTEKQWFREYTEKGRTIVYNIIYLL